MGKYDKFQTGLLLNIKCVEKTVSEDDYKQGELSLFSSTYDFDKSYAINETTDLKELFLQEINKIITITADNVVINNDLLVISILEDANGNQLTDVTKETYEEQKVFACYYYFRLSINSINLDKKDLKTLLGFEY